MKRYQVRLLHSPYTITDHNVNFYAKYVAGYYVDYDLNGGTWGSAQTKWFKNVGSTVVVVATEPEKTGYDFTGWTYSEMEAGHIVQAIVL